MVYGRAGEIVYGYQNIATLKQKRISIETVYILQENTKNITPKALSLQYLRRTAVRSSAVRRKRTLNGGRHEEYTQSNQKSITTNYYY